MKTPSEHGRHPQVEPALEVPSGKVNSFSMRLGMRSSMQRRNAAEHPVASIPGHDLRHVRPRSSSRVDVVPCLAAGSLSIDTSQSKPMIWQPSSMFSRVPRKRCIAFPQRQILLVRCCPLPRAAVKLGNDAHEDSHEEEKCQSQGICRSHESKVAARGEYPKDGRERSGHTHQKQLGPNPARMATIMTVG